MMMEWHTGLEDMYEFSVDKIDSMIREKLDQFLNDRGRKEIKSLIKKHGFHIVLSAVSEGIEFYSVGSQETVAAMFTKLPGICACKADPNLAHAVHVKNILRKKCRIPYGATGEIKYFLLNGVTYDLLKSIAYDAKNWDEFLQEAGNEWADLCASAR